MMILGLLLLTLCSLGRSAKLFCCCGTSDWDATTDRCFAISGQHQNNLKNTSEIPKFFINAYPGSILTGRQRDYCRTWPNQQEQMVIGIHYIQEDSPHLIGQGIARFLQSLGR